MNKNILITSALPYVNNVPHLGNIIGSTLSGDIYARYKRIQGHNVIYLCGTDEYGSTTTIKAKQEGISCRELCDKYHDLHKKIYDWFNIKFDIWGRTSTKQQTIITQEIFTELYRNGFIEEKQIIQLHCDNCDMFLADRYVKGICYHEECKGNNVIANGDQCDICQKLIDVNKLINPFCYICKNTPKPKETEHLFLALDKLTEDITDYLENKTKLSPHILSIAKSWLKMGLTSRCITRDLSWGTPVPKGIDSVLDKYQNKVFYVWFDAPFGYYSILANGMAGWKEWLNNAEWISTQAKDNIPFHTIVFPGSILGSKLPYPLISQICGTDYLLYEGKKFSKSEGVGLFGSDVIELSNKFGINEDYWRFYLIKIRPETQDSSFSLSDFVSTIKTDLINNIGNFINRCVSLTKKYCNNKTIIINKEEYESQINTYDHLMDEFRFRDALKLCLELSSTGNLHIQTNQPWVIAKSNLLDAAKIIGKANTICWILLRLLTPFIPRTIEKLFESITCDSNTFEINGGFELPFKEIKLTDVKEFLENK
ncbi:methionyl-tRNA synthetase [Tupanvirus soda lake]|uniref:methionine--tRNA ligase n=2 Tax=Tupanvirus TaxID=2094720 RepID=A0A6N1NJU8_9VIRU|nr:methionyl-tRNA synthetase [Tupanvirus soda lake]QKU34660.1 methionyl-tRNA synthetase [Tupanvirus soda lake]